MVDQQAKSHCHRRGGRCAAFGPRKCQADKARGVSVQHYDQGARIAVVNSSRMPRCSYPAREARSGP